MVAAELLNRAGLVGDSTFNLGPMVLSLERFVPSSHPGQGAARQGQETRSTRPQPCSGGCMELLACRPSSSRAQVATQLGLHALQLGFESRLRPASIVEFHGTGDSLTVRL